VSTKKEIIRRIKKGNAKENEKAKRHSGKRNKRTQEYNKRHKGYKVPPSFVVWLILNLKITSRTPVTLLDLLPEDKERRVCGSKVFEIAICSTYSVPFLMDTEELPFLLQNLTVQGYAVIHSVRSVS
jgi:hypothetical protein